MWPLKITQIHILVKYLLHTLLKRCFTLKVCCNLFTTQIRIWGVKVTWLKKLLDNQWLKTVYLLKLQFLVLHYILIRMYTQITQLMCPLLPNGLKLHLKGVCSAETPLRCTIASFKVNINFRKGVTKYLSIYSV